MLSRNGRLSVLPDLAPPAAGAGGAGPAADNDTAGRGPVQIRPEASAAGGLWPWQRRALWGLLALMLALSVTLPAKATAIFLAMLALSFLCVVALRIIALGCVLKPAAATRPLNANPGASLPSYTILVPLYREAHVVPGLIAALRALDYPADRLQILLITEAADGPTNAALQAAELSPAMSIVVVPDGMPRTKPRALNYALSRAWGHFVVVYDAEDAPAPDQLRAAAAMLQAADDPPACVQARLRIANADESWLTRGIA